MRVLCTSQDSAEWFDVRLEKVTASCAYEASWMVEKGSKVRGDKRWESSAKRTEYISELAWGMITRTPVEHFVSRAMDLGRQYEKMARAEYGFRYADEEIERTGFVLHPTLSFLGASPDGLLEKGGVELKVPQMPRHKLLLEFEDIPKAWIMQCYCNMLCCEKEWWDLASYMPCDEQFGQEAVALPTEFRMYRKRFYRNDTVFAQIEEGATSALEEAINRSTRLREMYPSKGAPKSKFNIQCERSVEALKAAEVDNFGSKAYSFLDSAEMVP